MKRTTINALSLSLILIFQGMQCFAQSSLNIHGYLSQAYAISREHQIFGILKNGTSDYRNLALQFRYDHNSKDILIVQLSHKRLGASPIMKVEEDIELDWAFYQRRINESMGIKIGKIQLPFGIYNEIRDVGVLLPFYQVPYSFYNEGNYASETVDGMSFWYSFSQFAPWKLETDFYTGQWSWVEWLNTINPMTNESLQLVETAKIEKVFGAQSWLVTPVDGLKLGTGFYHGNINGGINFTENGRLGEVSITVWNSAMDATFEKYFLRFEAAKYWIHKKDITSTNFYVQPGFNFTEKLCLSGYYGVNKVYGIPSYLFNSIDEVTFFDEKAVSVKYDIISNVVLKIEVHWIASLFMEDKPIIDLSENAAKARYAIFSFSTSF